MGKGQTAGANAHLQKQIDAINVSLTDVVIPLMLTDWTDNGDGTYSQTVAVNGLSGDSNPVVQLSPVGNVASADENASIACISGIKTEDGAITFIASEMPTISFTVIAKGVVAAGNDVAADITALVGRVSGLEEANTKLNSDILNNFSESYVDIQSGYIADDTCLVQVTLGPMGEGNYVSVNINNILRKSLFGTSVPNSSIETFVLYKGDKIEVVKSGEQSHYAMYKRDSL